MTGINQVDLDLRSPSYESRLYKYWRRGYGIYIPEWDGVRPEHPSVKAHGLERLLALTSGVEPTTYSDESNYSTVKIPYGKSVSVERAEMRMKKKDWLLNHGCGKTGVMFDPCGCILGDYACAELVPSCPSCPSCGGYVFRSVLLRGYRLHRHPGKFHAHCSRAH